MDAGKKKKKKRNEERYKLGETAGIRLTSNSGTTEEVVRWFNEAYSNDENVSKLVLEAIKLKIDMEKHYNKSQIERIRRGNEVRTSYVPNDLKDEKEASIDAYESSSKKEAVISTNDTDKDKDSLKHNTPAEEIKPKPRPGLLAFNSIRKAK